MPTFSTKSQKELDTSHQDLITLFHYVIKGYDNTIIYGRRSEVLQFNLYKKGRYYDELKGWTIKDKSKVVTYCDGINKFSDHNYSPSKAVDSLPYLNGKMVRGVTKKELYQIYNYAGFVLGVANMLYAYGGISHRIGWGGDWDHDRDIQDQVFMDLAHFYIIE